MTSPTPVAATPTSESPATENPDELLFERDGLVGVLTLNRPARRNALSEGLIAALNRRIEELRGDSSTRVLVLRSAGHVFCSGHDLGEMTGRGADEYAALFENCSRMMWGLRTLPQPVIALVQGFATGAGCQLVSACDLALASPAASFATPGVKLGLFCSTPMVPLVRSIPPKFAMEMLLTGQPVTAERAAEIGLVNRVVPAESLLEEGMELARRIASASGLTLAIGKRAFYSQGPLDERQAYDDAARTMTDNALTRDAQEGMTAFLQKRAPEWRGE
jgi:enoyl-CoA hydratase/carnithine racemase